MHVHDGVDLLETRGFQYFTFYSYKHVQSITTTLLGSSVRLVSSWDRANLSDPGSRESSRRRTSSRGSGLVNHETTLTLSSSLKTSTGITGLEVHSNPLPALTATYQSTLHLLESIPSASVYRQATEAITRHRLSVVEKANGDISAVEKELGAMVEQTLVEAKDEEKLTGKMIEWKA